MTTLTTSRFVDPRVLARISNLELLARTVVDGFVSGLHRSPHLGLSTDFAEHRPYLPGDDLRRLDWKLWGRTDRFYLKEFEADTNASVVVMLDTSRSMWYRSREVSKLDYGRFLAACLLWFSQHQRDRIGLITWDREIESFVPPSTRHLPNALHQLERLSVPKPGADEGRNLDLLFRKGAELVRRRSIIVVISDFYADPDVVLRALGHLRRRGSEVIVFHVLDPAELEFPFEEAAAFEDLETAERLPIVPSRAREQYRTRIREHCEALRARMARGGMDYTRLETARPLDHALFTYLSSRQRLSRVR